MNDFLAVLAPFVIMGLAGCKIPVAGKSESLVSNFRFEPEAFDSFRGVTSVKYTLAQEATTTLTILRATEEGNSLLVTTLFENLFESKGAHKHTWLGDTNEGQFASSGIYLGVLHVSSERYEAIVRVYHR
jgi:hypothetical protein